MSASFLRGLMLQKLEEEAPEICTIEWKQGSVLGFGGDMSQMYCEYKYKDQNSDAVFPVFVQFDMQDRMQEEMSPEEDWQFGFSSGIIFFVVHDKEQKPYQFHFVRTDMQESYVAANDMANRLGIDFSWIAGEYLVDL